MKIVVRTAEQLRNCGNEIIRQFRLHSERGLLIGIDLYSPPRTQAQNAKLHAMLAELAEALGYAREELKDTIKEQYGPRVTRKLADTEVSVPKGISEYSRQEASDMIEKLHYIAAECGITLRGE